MTQPASTISATATLAARWRQCRALMRSGPLRHLLLLGLVLMLLIWSTVILLAIRIQREQMENFGQDLVHLSEVLDETLVRQLSAIDNALLVLRSEYIDNKANVKHTLGLLKQGPLRNLDVDVVIIDRRGYVEISDIPGNNTSVYAGDREHFKHFSNGGPDQLFISDPVLGRLNKRWGMQLVRPILDHDGKFQGNIVIFVPPEQLTQFMQSLDVGVDTVMTVFSNEGVMLSRSKDIGKLLGSRQTPAQLADFPRGQNGFIARRSVLDLVERVIAYRWIRSYPLLLLVARPLTNVASDIARRQLLLVAMGGAVSLMVGTSLILLGVSFRRRERAEALLQREHVHLVDAQRISQLGSWELDLLSKRLIWSDEVFRILEIDKDQVASPYEVLLDSAHPDDREAVERAYADLPNQREPYNIDHRLRMRDGRVKWVREHFTSDLEPDGRCVRASGTLQDITARRQAEVELRIAEVAFQTQQGMFVTDANGVILRINNAFTEITGFTSTDALGQSPRILNSKRHNPDFFTEMWSGVNSTGTWKGEVWNRRKNGENYPAELTITAVRGDTGAVTHFVATVQNIIERKTAEEQIASLAYFDPLTKLPNRRLLQDRLQQALVASTRNNSLVALMFLDLDKFKVLNDTFGHDVGDLLLEQVAQRLLACVRESDTVARMGGDEFVVLLEALNEDPDKARRQAELIGRKILNALNQPYTLAGNIYQSTSSIGAILCTGHAYSGTELLKRADLAMYRAKGAGRNTLHFFDPSMLRAETPPASAVEPDSAWRK